MTRHAIEFCINAEDPSRRFIPSNGTLESFRAPTGPGVRLDSGVEQSTVVGDKYDSLLAKLIVVGADRTQALERARRAFHEFDISGVTTVLSFHRAILEDPAFTAESADAFSVHTRWIEDVYSQRESARPVKNYGNRACASVVAG